jgi:hypothetical protein
VACRCVGICRGLLLLNFGLALTLPVGLTPRVGIAFGLTDDRVEVPRNIANECGRVLLGNASGTGLIEQALQLELSQLC